MLDFNLTVEQKKLQQDARNFASQEILPIAWAAAKCITVLAHRRFARTVFSRNRPSSRSIRKIFYCFPTRG
jgi:hypothetical protein